MNNYAVQLGYISGEKKTSDGALTVPDDTRWIFLQSFTSGNVLSGDGYWDYETISDASTPLAIPYNGMYITCRGSDGAKEAIYVKIPTSGSVRAQYYA